MVNLSWWYLLHSNRKWCTVSWGVWLQLGHAGESDCLMRCRCLLRPMWPVRSWSSIEACARVSFETSCSHFFDGVVLSIALMLGYLDEDFHRRSHLWCISSFFFCRIAEILEGSGFLRIFGSKLAELWFPLAALFALVSAFSFGGKSTWPGTHWSLMSMTRREFAISGFAARLALRKSTAFCSLSCFSWSFSMAVCM